MLHHILLQLKRHLPASLNSCNRRVAMGGAAICLLSSLALCSCTSPSDSPSDSLSEGTDNATIVVEEVDDKAFAFVEKTEAPDTPEEKPRTSAVEDTGANADAERDTPSAEELRDLLNITEDLRPSFIHGEKTPEHQKYIVLHDTEGGSDAQSIIDWWDSNGNLVAAHFIVNKDGSVWQCAPLDSIVHHAGFGDTGHNELFGTTDESRDDKKGTTPIGDWASDYGMNSYSIGIEMVHTGGEGDYPPPQLEAVDNLIAYIDAYYGFESTIIDHKSWRSGNSDTSEEFAQYLRSYQTVRKHTSS